MSLFDPIVASEESTGSRALPGAALVKQLATSMATEIMGKIPQGDDEFLSEVKASQSSTAAMDDLVIKYCGEGLKNDEIAQLDTEDAKKILKSNQSSRSRRKNMAMTQANYVELLISAIAENIVRESCNMHKSANPFGENARRAMEITPETVAELANDPEALGKAIRNIQSKKSTYKAKHADEDYENSDDWQKLLADEALLKEARAAVAPTGTGRRGLSMKKALQYIFDGIEDVSTLGKDESHSILQMCLELSKGKYPEAFINMVAQDNAQEALDAQTGAVADAEAAADADVYAEANA